MKTFETRGSLEDTAEGYYVVFDHRRILHLGQMVQEPPLQVVIDNGGI